MIDFLIQYFTTYPDLAIFLLVTIFLTPVFLLAGQARVIVLIIATYLSYVLYLAFPRKDLLLDLKLHLFVSGQIMVFILGIIVISLFFFFTDFVLTSRRKFFFRTILSTFLLLMLFFSFYFELLALNYKNFSPFVQTVFLSDFSSLIWRGIAMFLMPFLL